MLGMRVWIKLSWHVLRSITINSYQILKTANTL